MRKKVILSAGGTGGHLFPAQAVADQLKDQVELLFVAGGLTTSPFFDRQSFPFQEISTSPLGLSLHSFKQGATICKGTIEARKVLKTFNPDLVVGFGSFYTLPVLAASKWCGVPFLLHEQNMLPGRVNRLLSPYAKKTAITFPSVANRIKGSTALVSFPIKQKEQSDAWSYFGWESGSKTLLICGGSSGAKRLNELTSHLTGYRILHIVGGHTDPKPYQERYNKEGVEAIVKTFEPRLDLAMEVADLAICRAGAATISELIAHLTPAILIPYPYAKDDHQWFNASYFADEVGGGIVIREGALDEKRLSSALDTIDLKQCRQNLENHRAIQTTYRLDQLILEQL